jgi:hypothetical protein
MPADKCYTKKNKNGGNYTTCVDKKGDQLREKDVKPKKKKRLYLKKPAVKTRPKPPPPPGMSQADADVMVKDVLNYNKISSATQDYEADVSEYDRILSATTSYNTNNVSDYNKILTATTAYEARQNTTTAAPLQNVSAHMSALSASAPTAPPANYNMLRPEIRRNILQFAGARSDVDGLINEILIAKPGFPKKIRLLEKYNNMLNSKQPYLFSITLPSKQAEVEILIDKQIKLEKKQRTLRSRMPKVMKRERISDGRSYSSGWDEGSYYKTNDLSDEQDPEDMAEYDRLGTALVENQRQMVLANRPRSEALGEDKHIFMEYEYKVGGGRKGIMKIFRAMKDKIDRPVLIKILKKVLESL